MPLMPLMPPLSKYEARYEIRYVSGPNTGRVKHAKRSLPSPDPVTAIQVARTSINGLGKNPFSFNIITSTSLCGHNIINPSSTHIVGGTLVPRDCFHGTFIYDLLKRNKYGYVVRFEYEQPASADPPGFNKYTVLSPGDVYIKDIDSDPSTWLTVT